MTFGASAAFSVPWGLRVRVEALLTEKGFFDAQAGGVTNRFELDYLEVPVLVGRPLAAVGSRLVPELYAGPWFA